MGSPDLTRPLFCGRAARASGNRSDKVDLSSLWPAAWITARPEHILEYRRAEAEAAASARRRRRAIRRAKTREPTLSP